MKFWIFQISILCLRPHILWEQKEQYVHGCDFKAKSLTKEGSTGGWGCTRWPSTVSSSPNCSMIPWNWILIQASWWPGPGSGWLGRIYPEAEVWHPAANSIAYQLTQTSSRSFLSLQWRVLPSVVQAKLFAASLAEVFFLRTGLVEQPHKKYLAKLF